MSIIDDIKRDAGVTSGFHWIGETLMAKEFGEVVELFSATWSGLDEFEQEHKIRIARVPEMESALIAADGLADSLQDWSDDEYSFTVEHALKLGAALAAYRKATGAAE